MTNRVRAGYYSAMAAERLRAFDVAAFAQSLEPRDHLCP
jgi:hypothetical protein